MILADSHCHLDRLDLTPFDGKLEKVIEMAEELNVKHFLCVAIDLDNFDTMHTLAQPFPHVHVSVGQHPNENPNLVISIEQLMALANKPKVVAIGETGLDYYRSEGNLEWQRDRFRLHIEVARQKRLPLIIHTRAAQEDTIRIMQEENVQDIGGVMHCFTENWEMAKQALDLGFYISFSGIVTFKNALQLQEVAAKVPLDRMLVETDAPYLAPLPFRGKPNVPGYVKYTADFLAELRNMNIEEFAKQTTENYRQLFQV